MTHPDIKHFLRRVRWYELAATIFTALAFCAIITFAILHASEVYEVGLDIFAGLMALITFAQAVQNWRKNRKPALICLGCGVVCTIFSLFACFAL